MFLQMKWPLALVLLGMIAGPTPSQTSSKPTTHRRSTKRRRLSHASAPSYQLHPDPERYQEIQKALADKGYFKGEVNGQWGDDSVDALKRFQTDQKLEGDGKIDSLSLIGLGLGPKHNENSAAAVKTGVTPDGGPVPPATDSTAPSASETPPH